MSQSVSSYRLVARHNKYPGPHVGQSWFASRSLWNACKSQLVARSRGLLPVTIRICWAAARLSLGRAGYCPSQS
eukprot:COSAG03_NODE_15605_length_425_cov_454.726994_1_plen_73_part_01